MIIGLDISTTIVGIALVDTDSKKLVSNYHVDITKYLTLYEKAEVIGAEIWQIAQNNKVTEVFIETALKRFIPGRSRADTLIKLAKFNGIVSWLCFDSFGMAPVFINVNTARSLYVLSFPRGTKGPKRKKMVVEAVIEREKSAFKYEMARGGNNYKKGTDDRADAVVIVRAGEYLLKNKDNKGFLTEKIVLVD